MGMESKGKGIMGTKWGKAKVDVSPIYGDVANWASFCPELETLLLFSSYAQGLGVIFLAIKSI